MEPEVIVFVPDGDVTLKLIRNIYEQEDQPPTYRLRRTLSTVQQTPIHEDKELDLDDAQLDEVLEDESLLFYAPEAPNASDGPLYPPTPRGIRGSDASSRRDRSSSPPASFWASLKRQQATRNNEAIEEEEETPITEQNPVKKEKVIASSHEVHCVVSSRHMMLASQVFENLLTGTSTEAKTLRSKGHVTIEVRADLDSVIILLNIIHGPSRKVPRQVTLQELSNLATLVSHFGMIETVQFFSDTWIDALQREGLPKTYTQEVLQLLFVFWVFDRPEEFKNMTRLAQRECDENLIEDVKNLPIPHKIIDAIKKEREYAIETSITIIHTLITRYMDGQTICDASLDEDLQYACDAMVLGCLMKSSRKIGLWPRPQAPFVGQNFKDIARTIRSVKILDVCNRSSRRFATLGTSSNCHGLEDELEVAMKGIEVGLDGLELLAYAKKSEESTSGFEIFVLAPEEEEVVPPVEEPAVEEPAVEEAATAVEEAKVEEPVLEETAVPAFQSYVEEEELHLPSQENGVQDSRDFHKEEEVIPVIQENEEHHSRDFHKEEVIESINKEEVHDSHNYYKQEDVMPAIEATGDFHDYSRDEVVPSTYENGTRNSYAYVEEPTTPVAEFNRPAFRSNTPEAPATLESPSEFEHAVQEGVRLDQEPEPSPRQQSHQPFNQNNSRGSSRASDYQVQEPVAPVIREEQKPVVSRNSPSQEWMNHGRAASKPTHETFSRQRDSVIALVRREQEEPKPSVERRFNRAAPVNSTQEEDKKSNGNGYSNGHGNGHGNGNGNSNSNGNGNGNGNGYGQNNGNGASRSGHSTPRVASVEEIIEDTPRVQQPSRVYHHERPSPERFPVEKRAEKTTSNERTSYPSPKGSQSEKVFVEKRPEKSSSNERILHSPKPAQHEKTSYPERPSYPERTSHSETTSYTAKKTPPPERVSYSEPTSYPAKNAPLPEVPVHQPQRQNYSSANNAPPPPQPTNSGQASQSGKTTPQGEKISVPEKKSYNGKVTQPEVSHQQRAVQNDKAVAHVEKVTPQPTHSSHPSYTTKPSQHETSSQQQKATTNGKASPHNQQERQTRQSQPSPSNGKSTHQESSQPQQKSHPTPPPPQSKTTSPAPQSPLKTVEPAASKEAAASETSTTNTEIDENWGQPQPQKFMRKSKKKFSTRF